MENDDLPVGRILSRRAALKLLGIGSAAFLAACASPEATSTLAPTVGINYCLICKVTQQTAIPAQ